MYLYKGVTIIGYTDMASGHMAAQSSELYSNNLVYLVKEMGGAKFKVCFWSKTIKYTIFLCIKWVILKKLFSKIEKFHFYSTENFEKLKKKSIFYKTEILIIPKNRFLLRLKTLL